MANKILIKHGSTVPNTSQLDQFELGYCTSDGKLYIKNGSNQIKSVFPGTYNRPSSVLSGANVFSNIVVDNGLITSISTRNLTTTNLGINGLSNWITANDCTHTILITGNNTTYYPVAISLPASKIMPTKISIWKNLGSPTASYTGNHTGGTSSMWLLYEARSVIWDGNGGYIKTLHRSMSYAPLCAETIAGSSSSYFVVYLRGGGTEYKISSMDPVTVNVYYNTTNVGPESHPFNVAPRTTLGNLGIYNFAYVAPYDISGVAAKATTLATPRTLTIGSTGKTFNGSANVSWSLAEIGAAASSHTHNYAATSHNHDTNYALKSGSSGPVSASTFVDSGIMYVTGLSGVFSGIQDGALYTNSYSSSWIGQIFQDYRSGQIALRGKNNGTWQSWRIALDSGNWSNYAAPKTLYGTSVPSSLLPGQIYVRY